MASPVDILKSHPHWAAIQKVYHTLTRQGYKAYLAGGCVRDALLGRIAQDLDLATDATPDALEKVFPKTVAVGKAFGVMLIIEDGISFEVATFRSDGSYKDGRRPDSVVFSSPQEDALRRDFTVNALFFDLQTEQVLDFVGGVADLRQGLLRAVGDPVLRFREDHLRVLRAVRFVAQLDFAIEPVTAAAVRASVGLVSSVSPERIQEEMTKLLKSPGVISGLELLEEIGLGALLFSGFSDFTEMWRRLWPVSGGSFVENWVRFLTPWALAGLDFSGILQKYRFSSRDFKTLSRALSLLARADDFWALSFAERLLALEHEGTREALKAWGLLGDFVSESQALLQQWQAWGCAMPAPWIRGQDLAGIAQGKRLGELLRECYLRQLSGEDLSREAGVARIRRGG